MEAQRIQVALAEQAAILMNVAQQLNSLVAELNAEAADGDEDGPRS